MRRRKYLACFAFLLACSHPERAGEDPVPRATAGPADSTAHPPHHAPHDTVAPMPPDTVARVPRADPEHGHDEMQAAMLMGRIGRFDLMTMAQVFPTFSFATPRVASTPLDRTGFYFTQPVISANLSSPGSRVVLRTTLNFEGISQEAGELTFGAWGEGFLDKRHPHTLLHELMLSVNLRRATSAFSLSAGRGFAPYGTDDPMSRPVLKYPTNHHLSQALERWTLIGTALVRSWSLEAGIFGGNEPTGPYDFSNIEGFPNSWSARLGKRFGAGQVGTWPWELSLSHATVREEHDGESRRTRMFNAAIRHEHDHGPAHMYALIEASRSKSERADPYYSVLAETAVRFASHLPYARIEYATRPEYARQGPRDEPGFFRYDHDDAPIGATRWLILSAGYGMTLANSRVSPRPYIEAQYNRVWNERGGIDPSALFGRHRFWSISAGMRIFVGGEPMRMGSYGILDAMTAMHDAPTLHAMSRHRH